MGQSGKNNTLRLRREAGLVVRQLGRPVPLDELYRQLIARGVGVDDKNFLSSKLAHATNLAFIRRRGWWLKSVPLPTSTAPTKRHASTYSLTWSEKPADLPVQTPTKCER
jgi:hypothetical protein